jgi:hypothetical protein
MRRSHAEGAAKKVVIFSISYRIGLVAMTDANFARP